MGWSAIATSRTTQSGSYQSQVSTAVNTAVDVDTGYIDAAVNWSAIRDGQAFYIIRGGSVVACRCAKSASTTRLTYYRLYTDDGVEQATDVRIGDTITLCEDAVTVGSGTALGSVVGITLTTTGAGAQIFRLYSIGNNALNVGGYFQFRHSDLVYFGTTAPDKTVRIDAGGFCVIGAYSTVKGVTRYERDILLRGTKAHSSNSSITNSFLSNDTSTSRLDWFGGTVEAGGCLGENVTTATTYIYSKAAMFRGLGQVTSQNFQWRPGGVMYIDGFTYELSEAFMVSNPQRFSGVDEKHCRMAYATSSATPANTWVTIKGASVVGGNSQTDVGAFATKWLRFINQKTGSAFVYQGNVPSANSSNNGLCEVRQEVAAAITSVAGSGITGRLFCRDTNNGVRKAANLWGTSPDYTADRTYDVAVSGGAASITSDGGILTAVYSQDAGFTNLPTDRLNFDWRGLDNSSTDRFLFGLASYGYNPATTVAVLKGSPTYQLAYTMLTDTGVTASKATAATYSDRFSIDASGNVTVTSNATLDELYDYAAWWLEQSGANMEAAGLGQKLIDFSGSAIDLHKNVTVNVGATLSSGAKYSSITTTGTLTISGAMAVSSYTSPAGTFVAISVSSLVAGSRIQIYNVTDAAEIQNSVVAGTSYSEYVEYTGDKSIRLRATKTSGVTAKAGFETFGTLTSNGLSFTANQVDCPVYNAYGIDGSTVTGISADYIDDEIDLTVASNFYISHAFAWWCYNLTTEEGIRSFFGGITPIDEGNIQVNDSIVSIFLDNTTSSDVWALDNRRFFRADGERPVKNPTTGGGGIDVEWREKVLFVNDADIQAIKAKTDNLPSDPADQSILAAAIADVQTSVDGIAIAGTASDYSPTSATRVIGDDEGGTFADLAAHDDTAMQTGEVVGTGLEVIVTRATSVLDENPSLARVSGYYNGGPSHNVEIQAWNFQLSAWEYKAMMLSRTASFDYTVPLSTDNHDAATGEMRLRFKHNAATYNASHYLSLDYVAFEKVATNSQLGSDVAAIKATVDVNLDARVSQVPSAVRSELSTELSRIDVATSTRLASSAYVAPDNAGILSAIDAVPTASENADAVWDETLTGANHNIPTSAGRRLRQINAPVVHDGIAQGSGTGNNQIVLAADASSSNGSYDPGIICIVGGSGYGQSRIVLQYDGATKTATVNRDWKTPVDATSEYIVFTHADLVSVNEGLARGGAAASITLNADASDIDDAYVGQLVFIVSGTGSDQAAIVCAYNGTTKVATVEVGHGGGWAVVPDTTSAYVMMPNSPVLLAACDLTAQKVSAIDTRLPSDPADQSQVEAAIAAIPEAPTASANASAVRTELATELARIDATVSSRLASSAYVAPDNASVASIKAKTDNLPSDPADQSAVEAAIAAIPAAPSAATVAGAVRTELATELARVDVATSTRLASASYVAPDNSGILAAVADVPTASENAVAVESALSAQLDVIETKATEAAANSEAAL